MDAYQEPTTEYENEPVSEEQEIVNRSSEEDAVAASYEEYLNRKRQASDDTQQALPEEAEDVQEEKPKKKKRRKRRKKHYFLRALILIALIFGAFKFISSDYFNVTHINVEGNRYYTTAQIIEMSGLETGKNIFFGTKTGPAKDALLADPYIKTASVKKVPKDTVEISVEERAEYAMIPLGDQFVIIDGEGLVLKVTNGELPRLPRLEGLTLQDAKTGSSLDVEQSYLLTDVLKLLDAMNDNDLYFKTVYFSTVLVKAYIYDDFYIEGSPANITGSMAQIRLLVNELYKDNIKYGVIKVGSDGYLAYSPQF